MIDTVRREYLDHTLFWNAIDLKRKLDIIIKPATIIGFYQTLVKRKYRKLHSNGSRRKPGIKPAEQVIINPSIEMKRRNPIIDYGRKQCKFVKPLASKSVDLLLVKYYDKIKANSQQEPGHRG